MNILFSTFSRLGVSHTPGGASKALLHLIFPTDKLVCLIINNTWSI